MKEETLASIEQHIRNFGRGRRTPELTAAERRQRAEQYKRALLAVGAGPRDGEAKKS